MSNTPDKRPDKLKKAIKHVSVCRDFFDGAIKVIGSKYIPQWSRESKTAYDIRIEATAFPNLYAPVITTLTGLVTKKEPDMTGLAAFDTENVDGHGSNLNSFIKQVCESSMVAGIEFVSVESDTEQGTTFFKRYRYEQLVSYQMEHSELSSIVFKEDFEQPDGEFGVKMVSRYVVFKVGGGSVWYDDGNGLSMQDEWENSLPEIPVVSIRTGKELSKFDIIPRFYDVVALSKVMLNLETQLANVLSVVGNPIPIFYGAPDDDHGIQIGVRDALVFEDKNAGGFEYAEIKGGGVDKLQDKLKGLGDDIDKISFGVLRKDDTSTVIEAQENQNKSSSFLSDVAEELEVKFNKLYSHLALIEGKSFLADGAIKFKKDFDDVLFSEQQLKMMLDMLNTGNISRETVWDKLKLSNILPKDFDAEREKGLIEIQPI